MQDAGCWQRLGCPLLDGRDRAGVDSVVRAVHERGSVGAEERDDGGDLAGLADIAHEEGLRVIAWREVPVETSTLSPISLEAMPHMEMLLVDSYDGLSGMDLERRKTQLSLCHSCSRDQAKSTSG